jgi:hypothetical protein
MSFKIMPTTKAKVSDLPGMTGPGVAPIVIPEVDKLVDKYVAARDSRLIQLGLEVEAKRALIDALHENEALIGKRPDGVIIYRHEELIVTLKSGKDDLKVKVAGGEDEE